MIEGNVSCEFPAPPTTKWCFTSPSTVYAYESGKLVSVIVDGVELVRKDDVDARMDRLKRLVTMLKEAVVDGSMEICAICRADCGTAACPVVREMDEFGIGVD